MIHISDLRILSPLVTIQLCYSIYFINTDRFRSAAYTRTLAPDTIGSYSTSRTNLGRETSNFKGAWKFVVF